MNAAVRLGDRPSAITGPVKVHGTRYTLHEHGHIHDRSITPTITPTITITITITITMTPTLGRLSCAYKP